MRLNRLENNNTNLIELVILVFLSLAPVFEYYYINDQIWSTLYYLPIILPYILAVVVFAKNDADMSVYRMLFLALILLVLIVTILRFTNDPISVLIFQGAIYVSIFTAYHWNKFKINFFSMFFKLLSILSIIAFIYIIFGIGVNLTDSINMKYGWTEIFYLATIFYAVVPVVIFAFLSKKNLPLALIYWFLAIIVNVIIQKRFIIVDTALLLACMGMILLLKGYKLRKLLIWIIGISMVIVIGLVFLNEQVLGVLNHLYERFAVTAENISEFDRFIEIRNAFSEKSIIDVIFGEGFAGTHNGLNKERYAIHVGWINFILKGGIFLFLATVFQHIKAFTLLKDFKNHPVNIQISICILLVYTARLVYVNMHSVMPEMLIYFICLFQIADYTSLKSLQRRRDLI